MRTVRNSGRISGRGVYLVWGVYLVRRGVYLVQSGSVPGLGGVPGPRGVYLVPGGCTWSGGYLVLGGVPGPGGCTWSGGVYLVLEGGVPGPGGCTWSRGVYLVLGGCLVRYSPLWTDTRL